MFNFICANVTWATLILSLDHYVFLLCSCHVVYNSKVFADFEILVGLDDGVGGCEHTEIAKCIKIMRSEHESCDLIKLIVKGLQHVKKLCERNRN